jgi:hypothetical protein
MIWIDPIQIIAIQDATAAKPDKRRKSAVLWPNCKAVVTIRCISWTSRIISLTI